jgi:myo-inositol catabolism protein IolS
MNNELKLPKIAMGAWAWGDKDGYFGNTMTGEEFRPIFDKSLELGLNLWDTATAYSNGESEKILGGFVNAVGREKVLVSTKFTPQMAAMYDNSVEKMCDASLERMNMEYFDIYWIHNPIGAPDYTRQLIPLLQSGKVKTVGVSNHNLAQLKEANAILKEAGFRVSAVQNHFSLMNRSSVDSGILDYCKENGITFYGYMTLEQGALSGKYDAANPFPEGSTRASVFNPMMDKIEIITAKMKKVAKAHDVSVAQIGTAYAVTKGILPILGVTKMYQVEEAVKTAEITLSDEEVKNLEAAADRAGVESIQFWESKME